MADGEETDINGCGPQFGDDPELRHGRAPLPSARRSRLPARVGVHVRLTGTEPRTNLAAAADRVADDDGDCRDVRGDSDSTGDAGGTHRHSRAERQLERGHDVALTADVSRV